MEEEAKEVSGFNIWAARSGVGKIVRIETKGGDGTGDDRPYLNSVTEYNLPKCYDLNVTITYDNSQ